jgi:hypothetical protein
LLDSFEFLEELLILWVRCAFLNVIGEWYNFCKIFIGKSVIVLEVIKQGLFITNKIVEFEMIMHMEFSLVAFDRLK